MRIRCALTFLTLIFATGAGAQSTPYRVISFNINALPQPFLTTPERLTQFKKLLPSLGADVIALQEAFSKNTSFLTTSPAFPYFVRGLRSHFLKPGDGLLILSKWPIRKSWRAMYSVCAGFADCLAKKGVLYAEVARPGSSPLHVFSTHLNAGNDLGSRRVRATQARELLAWVKSVGNGPVIVMGDFNADPGSEVYEIFRKSGFLGDAYHDYLTQNPGDSMVDPNGYTWNSEINSNIPYPEKPSRIDFIWYGALSEPSLTVENVGLAFTEPFSKGFLSDHFGVIADLKEKQN